MSIICIAKGTATIGLTTRGADGQIISQTPARWEHDPDGGCVALWTMNPETEEQEAPARMDICVYCQSFGCNECIVNEWKNERSDEE